MRTNILLLSILFILLYSKTVSGLSEDTHELINRRVAETTLPDGFSLGDYLINQLGLAEGILEEFDNKNVRRWLELGGRYEDSPLGFIPLIGPLIGYTVRSINHFHDPIADVGYHYGFFSGMSSIDWALLDAQTQELGYYSWHDVRDYYYKALTSADQNTRNTNFAETFRGIGQLMHHVQDATSPPHTRNDQHPEYNYETWGKDNISTSVISGYTPKFFTGTKNSMASFIDTDQYNIASDPDITDSTTIGIAEYTNANFFSNQTNSNINAEEGTDYLYPLISDNTVNIIGKDFVNERVPLQGTNQRLYYKKNCCGEKNDGNGYILTGVDYFEYYRKALNPLGESIKMFAPLLDHNVYSDYADLLLQRAIGYSAGLLEYFFRGSMEVAMSENQPSDNPITGIHLNVKNSTPDEDTGTGEIVAVALSDGQVLGVSEAQTIPLTRFEQELVFDFSENTIPADTPDLFVTVAYKGPLGLEQKSVIAGGTEAVIPTPSCINFTADVLSGSAPLTVTFTDTSSGSPTGWLWDFGDGFQSTEQNPVHIYTVPGQYSVTLKTFIIASTVTRNGWTEIRFQRNGRANSNAAAYAAWQADTWEIAYGVSNCYWWIQKHSSPYYQYGGGQGVIQGLDLSAYSGNKVAILELFCSRVENVESTILLGTGVLVEAKDNNVWVYAQDVSSYLGGLFETTIEDAAYQMLTTPSLSKIGWEIRDARVRIHTPASAPVECTNDNYITVEN